MVQVLQLETVLLETDNTLKKVYAAPILKNGLSSFVLF